MPFGYPSFLEVLFIYAFDFISMVFFLKASHFWVFFVSALQGSHAYLHLREFRSLSHQNGAPALWLNWTKTGFWVKKRNTTNANLWITHINLQINDSLAFFEKRKLVTMVTEGKHECSFMEQSCFKTKLKVIWANGLILIMALAGKKRIWSAVILVLLYILI